MKNVKISKIFKSTNSVYENVRINYEKFIIKIKIEPGFVWKTIVCATMCH